MAPTRSESNVTDLIEPEAPNESSAASASETPAFGDWREQLRERVKEIRARKLATRRESDSELNLEDMASAATTEKLEAARAQVSELHTESDVPLQDEVTEEVRLEEVSLDEAPPEEASEEAAPLGEALLADAEEGEAPVDEPPVQLVDGERGARRSEIADLVDDLLGPEPETAAEPEAEPTDEFSPGEVTMMFEPADDDMADNADPVASDETAEAGPQPATERAFMSAPSAPGEEPQDSETSMNAESDSEPELPAEPDAVTEAGIESEAFEDAGDFDDVDMPDAAPLFQNDPQIYADDPLLEVEVDLSAAEADEPVADVVEASAAPTPSAAVLDQIPPELRDVEIPAWALPREPSRIDPGPDAAAEDTETTAEEEIDPFDLADDLLAIGEPEPAAEGSVSEEPALLGDLEVGEDVDDGSAEIEEPALLEDLGIAEDTADGSADLEEPALLEDLGIAEDTDEVAAEADDDAFVDDLEVTEDADEALDPTAETDDEADDDDIDTYLVGEYTSVTKKRIDLGPPPDTPIRTEDLLDRPIGELAGLDEEDEVTIAPPGGLVDAESIQTFDVSEETTPAEPRPSLPGLFDEPQEERDAAPAFSWTPPEAEEISAAEEPSTDSAEEESEEDPLDVLLARKVEAEKQAAAAEVKAAAEVAKAAAAVLETESAAAGLDADAETEDKVLDLDSAKPPKDLDLDDVLAAPVAEADEPAAADDDASDEADDAALDWDVAPDPELVADARARHADPVAPVSDRVFSAVADGLVLLTMGMLLLIAGASAAGTAIVPFVQAAPIPFIATWLLFGVVYAVMFNGTCGQTLGKMAMRVRVIGSESFHVGYGTAALRALAYGAAALPAGLGLIPALRDPQHRGLHDRLTGTRVVKA